MAVIIDLSNGWRRVDASYVAGAGTEIIVAGTTIWTPPFLCLLRAFSVNDDSGNALSGAGGATSVSIGTPGFLNSLVSATPFANYANTVLGSGFNGPGNLNSAGDGGIIMGPAGAFVGRATLSRLLQAGTNAGTATGTLRFRMQIRPL
jgi:hypothetical protein